MAPSLCFGLHSRFLGNVSPGCRRFQGNSTVEGREFFWVANVLFYFWNTKPVYVGAEIRFFDILSLKTVFA